MNQINSILLAATIRVTIQGCAQRQPEEKALHESFYVDSVRNFSFCPLSDISIGSGATFWNPGGWGTFIISERDTQMSREAYRESKQASFKQNGMTVTLDSNLTFDGKDAILWEYSGVIEGNDDETMMLTIISERNVFMIGETLPRTKYSQYVADIRNSLFNFNIDGQATSSQNAVPKSLFVDSVQKFRFHPSTKGYFVDDSTELIASFFGSDTIVTAITATNTHTARDQWRQHQKEQIESEGNVVTFDSNLTVNGEEATLLGNNAPSHGEMAKGLVLSIIGKERVYTLWAGGSSDCFSKHETAIRNSLLSFKLF